MLAQLLENKKKSKVKTSSKKSKGKRKEGESSSSVHIEKEEHSNSESSKPSSEEGGNPENRGTHSKRMNKLEQRLEALTNRKGLKKQEWFGHTRQNGILSHILPNSKLRSYRSLTVKGHRTNISTTSRLRQGT